MPHLLRITRAQLSAVISHANLCEPEEACGILAGVYADGAAVVKKTYLMENTAHSATFYEMDSREQFQVFDEMRRDGMEPVAIFHSHPHSPAVPSQHDRDLAFYPDSLYLIVSLMNQEPESRVYRIADGKVEEAEMEVVEDVG
ncbi:MAG: M67 family metallopeptidase [Thermoleophilia bacterium]|nr:M67 family metallopeptidase [Thermoleophilia bacterium]